MVMRETGFYVANYHDNVYRLSIYSCLLIKNSLLQHTPSIHIILLVTRTINYYVALLRPALNKTSIFETVHVTCVWRAIIMILHPDIWL